MSGKRLAFFASSFAALAVMMTASSNVYAVPITFDGVGGVSTISGNLAATGTLSIQATANFTLRTTLPLFGTVSISGSLNIPNQSQPVSLATGGTIAYNPTGTGTVVLADENPVSPNNPAPFDGRNFRSDGQLPSRLSDAMLKDLDVTLIASHPLSTSPVSVNGTTTINTFLGNINIDTQLDGNMSGALNNAKFVQQPGSDGIFSTSIPFPPGGQHNDRTQTYPIVAPLGTLSGTMDAGVNADITFTFLGIPISQDLGQIADLSESLSEILPLAGRLVLNDLNPGGYTPPGDDMGFHMFDNGLLALLPLDFDLVLTGTEPLVLDTDIVLLGANFDVNVVGTATFALDAKASLTNLSYALRDTVPDVVSPEPSTVVLGVLAALGVLPLLWKRKRS